MVTKVENERGKFATFTLRLLLVTKVEKLKGKFATFTLRLLFKKNVENVLGNRKSRFKLLIEAETCTGKFVINVEIPAPQRVTQLFVDRLV